MTTEITEDAKTVYDLERGWFDRTQGPHNLGIYDIDCRAPTLGKKHGRDHWIYWGTAKTMEKAEKGIQKSRDTILESLGSDAQARIVNSKTGEVLKLFEEL